MNFSDRMRVTWTAPASPPVVLYPTMPCRFTFIDAVKNEHLFGAQTMQASLMIPLSYQIVEDGSSLSEYKFELLSPLTAQNLVEYMVPNVEKYTRMFRMFIVQVFQHGYSPEE